MRDKPLLRHLGLTAYDPVWRAMQRFTDTRAAQTPDEIWFAEHPPIFTLGLNARREHLRAPGEIPAVQIDRGGQVTYHGPGQLLIYPLLDLRRRGLGVRDLVVALENAIISYAAELGVSAQGSRQAPGVYVQGAKLASIGLRIRRGGSYHGAALNVAMDTEPFQRIDVCGHAGLTVTQLRDFVGDIDVGRAARGLTPHLLREFKYEPDQSSSADQGPDPTPLESAPFATPPFQSAISTEPQAVSSR